MNVTRSLLLLGFWMAFLATIGACQPIKPTMKEYHPQEGSLFRITFLYPATWNWEADPTLGKTYAGMTVFEPYPASEGVNPKSRLIGIDVWIDAKPQAKMQEQIDSHLSGIETLERLEIRDDRTLELAGHYARWLTIVNTWEYESPRVTYLDEFIYLLAEDRYYTITLYIPESETGGRFHTEFKAMVESIQILP